MKSNFLKQFDSFTLVISKEKVLSGDIQDQVDLFNKILEKHDSEELKRVQGKFLLVFDGYDDPKEELYEIEEVKSWVKKFVSEIPSFFHFFDDKTKQLITFCALDAKKVKTEGKTGYAYIEPEQLSGFIKYHSLMASKVYEKETYNFNCGRCRK